MAYVEPCANTGPTNQRLHSASSSSSRTENGTKSFTTNQDVDDADPSNIPLPESEINSRRGSSASDGRLTYRQKLECLSRYLPHLFGLYFVIYDRRSSYKDSVSPLISVLDRLPGSKFSGYSRVFDRALQPGADEVIDLLLDTDEDRVIVVEDLSAAMIELLGSSFKLDPDFFACHLEEAWPRFRDSHQVPWKTSALSKSHCSIKWWRPVRSLLLEKQNDKQWSEMMASPYSFGSQAAYDYDYEKDRNVFRREFVSGLRVDGSLTGLTAWEESVTINRTIRHGKTLFIVLVDPLPRLRYRDRRQDSDGEMQKWLPFKHIRPRGRQTFTPDGTLDNIETPNQIEELGRYFQKTQTTRNDILSWTCNAGSSQALHICSAIMKILESDTICLLEVITGTLVQVTEGTMDENLLQKRLSLWREVMTSYLIELPNIQSTLKDFGKFLKSCETAGDSYPKIDTLKQRIGETIQQTEKVYAALRTEISIIESKRGIAEAESVSKLTELAFIFIPISFAASVFGMQVKEFQVPPPIYAFVVAALVALGISYSMRLSIRSDLFLKRKDALFDATRLYAGIPARGPVPTHSLVSYLVIGFWREQQIAWRSRRLTREWELQEMQDEIRVQKHTGAHEQTTETLPSEDMP